MKNLLARAVEASENIGASARGATAEALRELGETGHLRGGVEEAEAIASQIGEAVRLLVLGRYTDEPAEGGAGTDFDNMQEMVARGRCRSGFGYTDVELVRQIRDAYDALPRIRDGRPRCGTVQELAERFGVHRSVVQKIGTRKSYVIVP